MHLWETILIVSTPNQCVVSFVGSTNAETKRIVVPDGDVKLKLMDFLRSLLIHELEGGG